MSKNAIVNISVGSDLSWYHTGQVRLKNSLLEFVEPSTLCFERYEHPKYLTAYADKIISIYDAYQKGYDKILYLDCSIKAIRPLNDIWDYIEKNGYYLYQSGANCAQTCNDNCLRAYNISRDEAALMYECASNVFGIDCKAPFAKDLIEKIGQSISTGAVYGVKFPTEKERLLESEDPRFLYHRQDQSVISLVAGLYNLKMEKEGHFVSRWENANQTMNDKIIFTLKGGF